jgi:CDGSH-type Zn-finger protein
LEATGPYKIEPKDFPTDGKAILICGCGLSNTMPYCDKAHKACKVNEAPGMLYTYDKRKQIVKTEPDPEYVPPAPPPPPPTDVVNP